MEYPVLEALHQAHLLLQLGKSFVSGHNQERLRQNRGHQHQLLQRQRTDGGLASVHTFLRLEYQDGRKKAPTQDYHGSGRPHLHQLDFVKKEDRATELEALALDQCVAASVSVCHGWLQDVAKASQADRDKNSGWPIHEGHSRFDADAGQYLIHHSQADQAQGIRGFFGPLLEVTKCHQDVQVDGHGQSNLAAYTAKYAPKFSDAMRDELLNDDAAANTVAAGVLSRYHPGVPEMAHQLFGSMFHPWYISTASKGKKDFNVPVPDQVDFPAEVKRYTECKWRGPDMCLLDFLRKSNEEGGIAGWLKEKWQKEGQNTDLITFAQAYTPDGEKVIACAMGSRLRDKYYGQWLMLHVPFAVSNQFMQANGVEKAPSTDKYLAACLACSHPVAVAQWNNPQLQEEDMLQEGHGSRYRQEVLEHIATQSHLVRQYLSGQLTASDIPAPVKAVAVRRRHKLAMLPRYVDQIRSGQKTVEGRLARGTALLIQVADLLQLGDLTLEVQAIETFPNFREMLVHVGYLQALPNAQSLDEAVAEYRSVLIKCLVSERPLYLFFPLRHGITEVSQAMLKTNYRSALWPFT